MHSVLFGSRIIVSLNGVNNANEQVNNAQLLRDSKSIGLLGLTLTLILTLNSTWFCHWLFND